MSSSPRRIVMVNDYDIGANLAKFRQGQYARHLLFGLPALEDAGHDVTLTGDALGPGWSRKRLVRLAITNLRTLVQGSRADIVYSASSYNTVLLGAVRRVTRRPKRLVAVLHGLPAGLRDRPRLFTAIYSSHDALAFLSPSDYAQLKPHLPKGLRAEWLPWGPEPAPAVTPTRERDDTPFAMSIGKSKRDWATLQAAHDLVPFPLEVVAGADCPMESGHHLVVHKPAPGEKQALTLAELNELYAAADVVVLAMIEGPSLAGLTVVVEALSAGKRVIISATSAMAGFADLFQGWVIAVPVGDPKALAAAVEHALATSPPVDLPAAPDSAAFEAALFDLLGI